MKGNSKLIYLDHAATTPIDPEVLGAMQPYLESEFGNASSIYALGRNNQEAIEQARIKVADLLGSSADEIYFTSGGTESDNWAIFGVTRAKQAQGNHIITSKIEHHAVIESCHELEKQGYKVTYLAVDSNGFVDPNDVAAAITDQTILVTIMHANNEVGSIQPIEEIGKLTREKGIHFHVDAVQSVGHIPVDVNKLNCDSLALSGHKIYGPKGVGAMFIRKGARVNRLIFGGGQERGRRGGTYNAPGIVGLGKAAEMAKQRMADEAQYVTALRNKLIRGIEDRVTDVKLNGDRVNRLPNNINFSFYGVEGESMILLLDMQGISASTGSACSSGSLEPSHVLMALGLAHEYAHGSLRLTLGKDNTEEDIDQVIEVLPAVISRLREMSPLYGDGAGKCECCSGKCAL